MTWITNSGNHVSSRRDIQNQTLGSCSETQPKSTLSCQNAQNAPLVRCCYADMLYIMVLTWVLSERSKLVHSHRLFPRACWVDIMLRTGQRNERDSMPGKRVDASPPTNA